MLALDQNGQLEILRLRSWILVSVACFNQVQSPNASGSQADQVMLTKAIVVMLFDHV